MFRDTALYAWPEQATLDSTNYSRVASIDDILLKPPSPHGFSEYQKSEILAYEEEEDDLLVSVLFGYARLAEIPVEICYTMNAISD
jgi:hypothetical protein